MNNEEVEFVERMGLMCEEDGLPRIAGRILGRLMLAEEPMTLDGLAEELQVSKASISTNTRLLDRAGFVDRTSLPGDRRAFYRIAPDSRERSLEKTRLRLIEVAELIEGVLPAVDEGKKRTRKRLESTGQWHRFVLYELEELMRRWEENKG